MFEESAGAIHDAIIDAPGYVAKLAKIERDILAEAEDAAVVHGSDFAAPNQKFNAGVFEHYEEEDSELKDSLLAALTCGNHVNNLIEVAMSAVIGQVIISRLFSVASLMRTGSFLLRIIASIQRWLMQPGNMVVKRGRPPAEVITIQCFKSLHYFHILNYVLCFLSLQITLLPLLPFYVFKFTNNIEAVRFAQEVVSYVKDNYAAYSRAVDEGHSKGRRGRGQYRHRHASAQRRRPRFQKHCPQCQDRPRHRTPSGKLPIHRSRFAHQTPAQRAPKAKRQTGR